METSNETICTPDLTIYSWDTSHDPGMLLPLSFKFGLYFGLQLVFLSINFSGLFKKGLKKIPFFIQLSWFVSILLYNLGYYYGDLALFDFAGLSSYAIAYSVFDTITKVLVIYFVCIRMLIASNLQKKWVKWLSYALFGTGIVCSFLVNFIPSWNVYYLVLDLYVSIIEIFSLYLFIYTAFSCDSFAKVVRFIIQSRLVTITVLMILSAILSGFMTVLEQYGLRSLDFDYNFSSILTMIKYHMSCDLVVAVFAKTFSSKNQQARMKDSAGTNLQSINNQNSKSKSNLQNSKSNLKSVQNDSN